MGLCFSVHNLEIFSSNPGRVHFEGLVHLLRYIWYNKNLGLNYYSKIEDAHLSDILIQDNINTDNQLMVLYGSSQQDCSDTAISAGAYIVFYQGVTIYHYTYVTGTVAQSTADNE